MAARLFLAGVAGLILLAGCSQQPSFEALSEVDEPIYRRAKDLYDRGLKNEALENYLNLIQRRNGNAPESHLEAGNIYLNHVRDPISAIYHFKRYKALLSRVPTPEARQRIELVDDLIRAGSKEFAATFEAKVFQDPLERLKLMDSIQELRSENELLKRQLAETRNRLSAAGAEQRLEYVAGEESAPPASAPAPQPRSQAPVFTPAPTPQARAAAPTAANQRTYTIQRGDSLYRIAREAYGDSSRWRDILNANRDVIPDPTNLRVGTSIVLP